MLCHSSSRSVCNPSNSRVQVPFFDHRSNRLNTVFHGPNSMGRSRHGTPVRRHHKTASTNFRLSFPRRPGPRFSARTKAIFAHFRSSNWSRTIDSPWSTRAIQWKAIFLLPGTGTGTGTLTGGPEFRDRPKSVIESFAGAGKSVIESFAGAWQVRNRVLRRRVASPQSSPSPARGRCRRDRLRSGTEQPGTRPLVSVPVPRTCPVEAPRIDARGLATGTRCRFFHFQATGHRVLPAKLTNGRTPSNAISLKH